MAGRIVALLLALCMTPAAAMAQETSRPFALPAQPLQDALEQFMTQTGQSGLYDSAVTRGRVSAEVEGLFTPEAALRRLLAGSGLALRYAADGSFTLTVEAAAPPAAAANDADARAAYFGQLQAGVRRAFCAHPLTAPGEYRVALSLWIAPSGTVRQVHLLDGSGSAQRDARVTRALLGLALPALPQQVQIRQPVTLLVTPRAGDCEG